MVWVLPVKRSSKLKSQRFSKYTNVDQTPDVLLQRLKKRATTADRQDRPAFRIVTRTNPWYVIARADSFEELRDNEWRYITRELPGLIPANLDAQGRTRQRWLLAHFFQLGVEAASLLKQQEQHGDHAPGSSSSSSSQAKTPSPAAQTSSKHSPASSGPASGATSEEDEDGESSDPDDEDEAEADGGIELDDDDVPFAVPGGEEDDPEDELDEDELDDLEDDDDVSDPDDDDDEDDAVFSDGTSRPAPLAINAPASATTTSTSVMPAMPSTPQARTAATSGRPSPTPVTVPSAGGRGGGIWRLGRKKKESAGEAESLSLAQALEIPSSEAASAALRKEDTKQRKKQLQQHKKELKSLEKRQKVLEKFRKRVGDSELLLEELEWMRTYMSMLAMHERSATPAAATHSGQSQALGSPYSNNSVFNTNSNGQVMNNTSSGVSAVSPAAHLPGVQGVQGVAPGTPHPRRNSLRPNHHSTGEGQPPQQQSALQLRRNVSSSSSGNNNNNMLSTHGSPSQGKKQRNPSSHRSGSGTGSGSGSGSGSGKRTGSASSSASGAGEGREKSLTVSVYGPGAFCLAVLVSNLVLLLGREVPTEQFALLLLLLNAALFALLLRGWPCVLLAHVERVARFGVLSDRIRVTEGSSSSSSSSSSGASKSSSSGYQRPEWMRKAQAAAAASSSADADAEDDTVGDSGDPEDEAKRRGAGGARKQAASSGASSVVAGKPGKTSGKDKEKEKGGKMAAAGGGKAGKAAKADPWAEAIAATCMDRFWTRSEVPFQVRVGPNYERNKQKATSAAAFYDVLEVRLFQFERKVPHASRYLPVPKHRSPMRLLQEAERQSPASATSSSGSPSSAGSSTEGEVAVAARLASAQERAINGAGAAPEEAKQHPELEALEDGEEEWLGVPRYLVLHFQVPMYEPKFFSKVCDGHNLSIVAYFRLRPDIEAKLRAAAAAGNPNSLENNERLLQRFFSAPDTLASRMKCIAMVANQDDIGLGKGMTHKLLTTYNGKPFLTAPEQNWYRGPGYLEWEIDIHRFKLIARKGLWSMLECFQRAIMDCGMVIQSEGDAEMPERLLCDFRISQIQVVDVPDLPRHIQNMLPPAEN